MPAKQFIPRPNRIKNLLHRPFGSLTVWGMAGRRKRGSGNRTEVLWLCRCSCGRFVTLASERLLSGNTQSCGCSRGTHKLSRVPEYTVWENIIQRTSNPKNSAYKYYAGRGITLYEPWRDFAIWYAYVGSRPTPLHTLERINNDGNYEPGNVKWATRKEQMQNTRRSRLVTFNDETMSVSAWAERLNILSYSLFYSRLKSRGFDAEQVFPAFMKSGDG